MPEVPAVKDEDAAHPVASAWRPLIRDIVAGMCRGDFAVVPIDQATQTHMRAYVADSGETLDELPDATWSTSVAQWMGTIGSC